MKKIIYFLLATISISNLSFSQETEFKFDKEGFTDFVVTQCEGKTQAELYKKALDWVSVTYKNPKEVIKAQIENDYIRIEGSSNSLICLNILGKKYNNATYQIDISFKDGKYKFDVIEIRQYTEASQYSSGGWSEVGLATTEPYYNKKGEIRGVFKYFPEFLPTYFNKLNLELKDFLLSDKIPSKKSEW
jgi:hypothetical protein